MMNERRRVQWRLILGQDAESVLGGLMNEGDVGRDRALDFLYDEEGGQASGSGGEGGEGDGGGEMASGEGEVSAEGEGAGGVGPAAGAVGMAGESDERLGGLEKTRLTAPTWINMVHELFPQRGIERLEAEALGRDKLAALMGDGELLGRVTPSEALLKAVLRSKHLMDEEVLAQAQSVVATVVAALREAWQTAWQQGGGGARWRGGRALPVARNFDAKTTIRRNLAHYNREEGRLYVRKPYFQARVRPSRESKRLIILVDQSESMVDSLIQASVMAAVFKGVGGWRTHLCLFDTAVVDLSEESGDPLRVLFQAQLGGGTDISQALLYAEGLVTEPRETIIVLVSDFYEGAPSRYLLRVSQRLLESGVRILGLAAVGRDGQGHYNRALAKQLVGLGMEVGAMTPDELVSWLREQEG
ncbi:MAG TPA: VWA domain-containing protein [Anaerolineae bacterium]|nr:VWA domain-containing protein [Anaerolineae bacterium]